MGNIMELAVNIDKYAHGEYEDAERHLRMWFEQRKLYAIEYNKLHIHPADKEIISECIEMCNNNILKILAISNDSQNKKA